MSRKNLQEEWERRIALFKASGMTQAKWCENQNVSIHKLKYWLYKIERQEKSGDEKTNWISMMVEDELPNVPSETIQIKINQATIEVRPDFNPTFLAEVVKVLKTTC